MNGTQWSELAGAVVTIIIAVASYIKAHDAHARSMRVARRVTSLEINQAQTRHPTSQVAEAENPDAQV